MSHQLETSVNRITNGRTISLPTITGHPAPYASRLGLRCHASRVNGVLKRMRSSNGRLQPIVSISVDETVVQHTTHQGPWLIELVNNQGKQDWRQVAAKLPGRTNKDCRKRWINAVGGDSKKGRWDDDEDKRLLNSVKRHNQR